MKKPLKTSPKDRECAFPGCKCILSIYNHDVLCRVHNDKEMYNQKIKHYHHVRS